MKTFNKRLLSVVLVLAMALAMLPMAVIAANGDYTVAGNSGLCGAEWDPTKNPMTDNGDGTYSITFANVAAGTYEFKVTDGSWSNSWGKDGSNYQITLSSTSDVTINFDSTTTAITVESDGIAEAVYYLCGSMNGWAADDSNKMTKQDDGTYAITLSLEAGTYEYKAATDDWSFSIPGYENAVLNLAEATDVTFVLNVEEGTLTNDAPVFVDYDYYVAGSKELCGVEWDPTSNPLVEIEDGIWCVNLFVYSAGTYEYKITTGSWETPSYGNPDGTNYSIVVKNPSTVHVTFNEWTKEVTCEVEEWGEGEMKVQLNADASADDATVDLRMITHVDSLDYTSVTFFITIEGETAVWECEYVYTAIKANGESLTCQDIFGCEGYLVTVTLTDIPAAYYDSDIQISAEAVNLDGYPTGTNPRTIVLSDILA